jgi:hypothetical protein
MGGEVAFDNEVVTPGLICRLIKVLHPRSIRDQLFAECGYGIIVDDSGRPAISAEMEDT